MKYVPVFNVNNVWVPQPGWTKNKSKPEYNNVPANYNYGVFDQFILDLDVKRPTDDVSKLLAHLEAIGICTNTYQVKTKSGGLHLYYQKLPSSISYKDKTGWLKTDHGNVDIRGNNTWARGPDTRIPIGGWREGLYVIVNDIPPIEFTKTELLNVTNVPVDYLRMQKLADGERDEGIFNITKEMYKGGKTLKQVLDHFETVEIEGEFDVREKVELCYERMAEHLGANDKLVNAMKDFIYVKATDNIFNCKTHQVYPAATFGRTLDNDRYEYMTGTTLKKESLTKIWLEQGDKRRVDYEGWKPVNTDVYTENGYSFCNTYSDATYMPGSGKRHEVCEMYDQLLDHLTMGRQTYSNVITNALRWHLEEPLKARTWSVTIIGTKGTGKGILWETSKSLVGGAANKVNAATLRSGFNKNLARVKLLLFNEMDTTRGLNYAAMKELITDKTYTQTGKGTDTDSFERQVYHSSFVFANSAQGLRLERSDRRHFIINCTNYDIGEDDVTGSKFGREWVDKYVTYLSDTDAMQALTSHIRAQPYVEEFSHTSPHKTEWFLDMCAASKTSMALDIVDALDEDNEFAKSDIHTPSTIRLMLVIVKNYKETLTPGHCSKAINELVSDGTFKVVKERGSMNVSIKLGSDFKSLRKVHGTRGNPRLLAVRSHDKYKELWDAQTGFFPHLSQDK